MRRLRRWRRHVVATLSGAGLATAVNTPGPTHDAYVTALDLFNAVAHHVRNFL